MKIKRIKLLTSALSLFIFIGVMSPISALNNSTETEQRKISLANEHVSSVIADYLIGISQNSIDLSKVKMHTPIKVGGNTNRDYYLYPVSVNDIIKYVCRVHYDGKEFVSTLSEQLPEEFQSLFNQKQKKSYTLAVINDNLVLIQGEEIDVWAKDKYEKPVYKKDIESYLSSLVPNCFENNLSYVNLEIKADENKMRNTRATYYLTIDYLNQQTYNGGYPWCAGYVAANILRYMTGDRTIYASDIASFGDIATNEAIPRSLIKQYANYVHHIIVSEYNGIANLTNTVLNYQLSQNQPIYGSFIQSDDSSSAHAIVVHGFNGTVVTFRNPWHSYSETYKYNAYAFVDIYGDKWVQRGYMTFE